MSLKRGSEQNRIKNRTPKDLKSRCRVDDETAGGFVPDGF